MDSRGPYSRLGFITNMTNYGVYVELVGFFFIFFTIFFTIVMSQGY
jgi:hypothetical protein